MNQNSTRVLLVDDHAIVREGYRTLLSKCEGLSVVGEAEDALSAYHSYKETQPDVVIMDISMPGRGGIDAMEHIRRWDPTARFVVSTMHCGAAYVLQAFRAGAKGYVAKTSSPECLIGAVRDVAKGKVAICPETSHTLALSRLKHENLQLEELSPREFEVLRMLLDAKSADDISSSLNISRKTVANYHYNIKSKLGVTSDIELFYFGLRQKLINAESPETHFVDSDATNPEINTSYLNGEGKLPRT